MEARKMARSLLASIVLAVLAAQAFVGVVGARSSPAEKGDVKKPDCVPGMDPRSFPGIGGHGGITPVPSHGGITPVPSHGGSTGGTPSHGGSSSGSDPSHGGGYGGSPSHGGSSGGLPSPSHGGFGTSPTSPSTGGGYGGGSPATPSHDGGAYGSSPTPSHGGAYGSSPTPSHGAYGGSSPPALGGLPATTAPMPFVPVDPHSPTALPGSCDYWRSHPMEIWSAISNRFPSMNMGHFFGTAGSSGSNMSIQDALANTRTDGAGALLREGAAALLNSMTRAGFPYTTDQVRDAFAAAAAAGGSDGAAAAQAAAFKKANEGTA